MEFTYLFTAKNREELRKWLADNHDKEKAMCFGRIHSTTKKMDNGRLIE